MVATDAKTPSDKMPIVMILILVGIWRWRSKSTGISAVLISVKMFVTDTKYDTFRMIVWPELHSPGSPHAAATGLHWKIATGHDICQTIQLRPNNVHKIFVYMMFRFLASRISVQTMLDLIRAPSKTYKNCQIIVHSPLLCCMPTVIMSSCDPTPVKASIMTEALWARLTSLEGLASRSYIFIRG